MVSNISDSADIIRAISERCPNLTGAVNALSADWLEPAIARLTRIDNGTEPNLRRKHLNDPIWRTFELEQHEVLLLDCPLLQRMRGVKQLGLANLVFSGANHDRFEHICGVVESADRMYAALKANADRRRESETRAGRAPPDLSSNHRRMVRLAALLHDVGHGPFSHAIEPVVNEIYREEVVSFNKYIIEVFYLDSRVAVAELISILIILSPSMGEVLRHSLFQRPLEWSGPEFQLQIAALVMGARWRGQLACLSAIVSGQVDADKLDYMARDAHHSGMPIAFDTERLLRKLEVIRCTADNLPPNRNQDGNRKFADESDGGCYFDLGIAAAGVGALEQMLIGRAFLYDRLYHHHKVRAADAMAQRLLYYAREERGAPFALKDLYSAVSDDTMLRLMGGDVSRPEFEPVGQKSRQLAKAILGRDLYVRAFAFRAVFHTGIPNDLDDASRNAALSEVWAPVSTGLSDLAGRLEAESHILAIAKKIGPLAADAVVAALAQRIDESHIIVDLADNRVKRVTINVHAEDGSLEEPSLFFDSSRWSHVYDLQKRTGYVFCPRDFVPLVALASKIFFFEKWGYAVSDKSDRFTKTLDAIKPSWIAALLEARIIDPLIERVLKREATIRTYVHDADLNLPGDWTNENPKLSRDLADDLRSLVPQGLSAQDKEAIVKTIEGLCAFVLVAHQDATWATQQGLKEAELQTAVARHLRARGLDVDEGGKLGGGEFDLLVEKRTLIENKVTDGGLNPFEAKPDAPYQANRYAIAKCMRVFFTLTGYQPTRGAPPIEQSQSIKVRKLEGLDRTAAEVCVVVPFGLPTPSRARRPN